MKRSRWSRILRGLLLGAVLALLVCAGVNAVLTASERRSLVPEGVRVAVGGKSMNVLVTGTGEQTVVLLSGYGTNAPALDFAPLVAALSEQYRVAVVEPFGYGYSDITEEPRSVENITEEIHEALRLSGISEYILMPHSLSGIYALYYVHRYPAEVTAIAGMDTSVQNQLSHVKMPPVGVQGSILAASGVLRLATKLSPEMVAPQSDDPAYTPEVLRDIRLLTIRNFNNPSLRDESAWFTQNFAAMDSMVFPKDVPVLLFLSSQSVGEKEWWLAEHEAQLEQLDKSKLVVMDGGHYLHWTHAREMAGELIAFLS